MGAVDGSASSCVSCSNTGESTERLARTGGRDVQTAVVQTGITSRCGRRSVETGNVLSGSNRDGARSGSADKAVVRFDWPRK